LAQDPSLGNVTGAPIRGAMKFSAETKHLLEKRLRYAVQPLEILLCALLSSIEFWIVYWSRCFSLRYTDPPTAWLLVIWCLTACIVLTLVAAMKYRSGKKSRAWIAVALTMWAGLVGGFMFGDRYWYEHTVNYYNVKGMASYINIDPATDKGESYMDAGTVYFKENSRVQRETAVAFRNGLTYCVAPIIRTVKESKPGEAPMPPASGTVDFWAVGIDCCGKKGETFTCGDAGSTLARSGLRLMDGTARSMFLLGVQEWSAGTGLPVRHPVFFNFVIDPIVSLEGIMNAASEDLWMRLSGCFLASLIAAFVLHVGMQKLRVL